MSKTLKIIIAVFFLIQLAVAASFELAHDEAYYWLYSQNLAWGYFDHPPMVGVTIRLFSFLPHQEWALRLGFILQQLLALFILLKMLPQRFHLRATLMYLAFPLASFSGLFALPDMPLLFSTALYCWMLKRYLEDDSLKNTVAMGVIIPLLLYSKYHGILLIFFTLLSLPKLLKRRSFYLITLLAIICFLPHVWWQYQHDFSTLRYHFLERPSSGLSFKRLAEYLGLQIVLMGVLAGPVIWWAVLRHKVNTDFERAMKWCSLGIVLFFFFSTLSKKFEANWTIFAAIPIIYLAAQSSLFEKRWAQSLLVACTALVIVLRFVLVLPAEAVSIKRLKEFKGWEVWSRELQARCEGRKLVANSYQIASKLSYYLNQEVPALNYHSRKNQFDYWNFQHGFLDAPVCYVTDKQEFQGEEITTPEGKRLKVVPMLTAAELWKLKAEQDATE